MAFQQLRHDGDTDAKTVLAKFLGDLGAREIGPEDSVLIRIARGTWIDDLQKGFVQSGKERQTGASAAPFFRARSAAKGKSRL